jgi:type IV pilus assembly protein PilX
MKSPLRPSNHQRGATLIFTLLALVALLLSSLTLVRSVDVSAMLMGNLGFKQDTTASGDRATSAAISWLTTNLAKLGTDLSADGYYATSRDTSNSPLDVTGAQLANAAQATRNSRRLINWAKDGCAYASSGTYANCDIAPEDVPEDGNGNTARYVIFRMCDKAGDPATDSTIKCARPPGNATGSSFVKGELNYSDPLRFKSSAGPYYRIVVRVEGARNTVSFTETVVHF